MGRRHLQEIDGLLSPRECQLLLRAAEESGFCRAHQPGRAPDEVFIENRVLADRIKNRLREFCGPVEVDARFEIYRYKPGDGIATHTDGSRTIRSGLYSNGTLLVYLSEGFPGGSTVFTETNILIVPVVGRAVVFSHGVLHRADTVLAGTKYVARLDIVLTES
jgi:hypothetical protein